MHHCGMRAALTGGARGGGSPPGVEILGLFLWAHIRFQKFLEISKHMCMSLFDMQPKLLAVQREEVGAKFMPT
jgi:hypothetical protein